MPSFQYSAVNADGSAVNGLVFGSNLESATAELQKRGLNIEWIEQAQTAAPTPRTAPTQSPRISESEVGPAGVYAPTPEQSQLQEELNRFQGSAGPSTEARSYFATSVWGPLAGRVPLRDLAFFFSQLGTMMQAGVPMVQSLGTLTRQARNPKFKSVLAEIQGHVEAGRPMSAGMQRYPEVFTPVMMSVVRAGEQGGFLDTALKTVAQYLDEEIELRNLYRRVTFYPKLQVFLSIVIILGANAIIASIKPGAPGLSSPLTKPAVWAVLVPVIVVLFLFLRVGLANFQIKYAWDLFVSNIPYVGTTMRQLAMAKFGRAFGALYRSGVDLPRTLQLAADACGNEYLRARIYPARTKLESGAGITETLSSTQAFSPIVIDMVSTGEQTGQLDQMLGKMADYYQDESKTRSVQLGYVVGTFLGLCVAIYIGYIVIGFYQGYGQQVTDMVK